MITPDRPTPEMQAFFENKLQPIMDSLLGNKCRDLELIQSHFNNNRVAIRKRYGRDAVVGLVTNPTEFSGGQTPSFCCRVERGSPVVMIVVPNLMLSYQEGERVGQAHIFSAFVVLSFVHEFDHHALGLIPNTLDIADLILREKVTWAQTCEKVIVPMVRVYHRDIGAFIEYYDAWMRCGKNVESPAWTEFVRGKYGFIVQDLERQISSADQAIADLFG